jgi:general secretion pathway protein J
MNGSSSIPFSAAERKRRPAAEAGFTLLEVLVAVAITALLLATVYGVFTPISAARDRLEGEALAYHEARVLLDRIGRELRSAYLSPQPGAKTRFEGGRDAAGRPYLLFSTTAGTPQPGSGGVALVRYELDADPEAEPGRGGQVLLRGEAPVWAGNAERAPAYRLGADIVGLGLRFHDGSAWQEQWPVNPGQPGRPQQVEVTLTLRIADGEVPFVTACELPQ